VTNKPPLPPRSVAEVATEASREEDAELLKVAETRRSYADTFAWTVPGLAIAAEAFLLSIALDSSTQPAGRLVAALAGSLILYGALHFIEKQSYNFDLYDALIERQRERLGLMSLHRETIQSLDLPEWVGLYKRGRLRTWFARNCRAVFTWRTIVILLLLINLALLAYSLIEWADADPGWLSP
jgi:hypothetical protein